MRIVLIAGDHVQTLSDVFYFGVSVEVPADRGRQLLTVMRDGARAFMEEREVHSFPKVRLKLVNPENGFSFHKERLQGEIIELHEPLANYLIKRGLFRLV
jgi:hypothetical protein